MIEEFNHELTRMDANNSDPDSRSLAFIRGFPLCSLCLLLLNLSAFAAAPIQLHINTAVDTASSAFKKTETNFTTLFQSVTSLTNTITYYGATNSPTVFSTTNLQLALDSSRGNAVIVPGGRFLIGATIDLPDNTRLIGDGMSSILVLTNVDLGLSIFGKTNIQIIGLKFVGKYAQAISALYSTNVLVRECDFTDATLIPQSGWLAPIHAQSSFGIRIEKCNFYGNGSTTSSFDSSAEILIGGTDATRAVTIEDCTIVGQNTHYGIALLDLQDGRVVNNFIDQGNVMGVLNVGGYGIQSIGTLGYTALRNIIAGNTITNAAGSGIYLSNNIGSKVVDNHVSNVSIQETNGIARAGGIVLENTILSDLERNSVSNSPTAGLVSSGRQNAILDNNLVNTNSTGTGILLTGWDTTVDRNFVRGFATGINNTGASNRVGILNLIHDNSAPLADAGGAVVKTITTGSAPSVRDAPSYLLNYPSPTSITDFTDGLPGMDRTFFAANTNVTLINSAGLLLAGGSDLNLVTDQVIVLRRDASNAWHQIASVGSVNFQSGGETNTASNLGTPGATIQGLFKSKVVHDLQFRSLESGSGVTLSSNATTVTISATSGETNTTANLGTQSTSIQGLASTKSGLVLQFRSLEAGSGITLTSNATTVAIAAVSGETNTASNLGTQGTTIQGLFGTKVALDLRFRSLEAGTGVTLTSNATTVTIASSTGPGGETNTASNLGTPGTNIQGWFSAKSALDLRFRSIQAGTGIALSSNANTVTVSATAPGGAYSTVMEEAIALTPRDTINFVGPAITATDNAVSNRTDITLSQSPASASVVGTGRLLTAGRGLVGGGDLSADRTLSFNYTDTLASNPSMNANEAEFGNNGILFEGSIADTFEGYLTPVNPTADRTWTLPNASGTLAVSATLPLSLSALGNITITNIPRATIATGTPNVVLINDGGGEMAEAPLDPTQLTFSVTGLGITNNASVTNFTINGNLAQNTADIAALDIDWSVADFRTKACSGANAFTFSGLPTDGKVHFLQVLLTNSTGSASATFTNIDWRVPLGPFSMASITNGVQQVTFMLLGGIVFGDWTGGSSTNGAAGLGDPVAVPHGGTGNDLSPSLDGAIPFFDQASGKFISSFTAYTNAIAYSQSIGWLSIFRTNITGGPLLLLVEGSGSVPALEAFTDRILTANTNLTLEAPTGYSVRARINGVTGLELTPELSVVAGYATTNSTRNDGFIYIPAGAGPPTGTPAAQNGKAAYYDLSADQFYFYNGAWVRLNPSNWQRLGTTNSFLTGNGTLNSLAVTNGLSVLDVAASSLIRTDSLKKLSAITIGQNLSFDGTTLSATPSANWTASGTTNSTLPGVAYVNSLVITNALTLSAQTASRVLGLDASKNVVTSFSSARLSDTLTDETGSGSAVFATAPVLVTPTNSGLTTFTDRRRMSGVISPTQITADKNDYNPTGFSTASVVRINSDAARNVTGLLAGGADDEVLLFNVGSFNITLLSQHASSDATNRFALVGSTVLSPNQGASLIYDGTSSRWRALGVASGTGTTINPTDTFLPMRSDATTFVDSPLARIGAGAVQLNGSLSFNGATASFPMLTNSGTTVTFRTADNSGVANLTAGFASLATYLSFSKATSSLTSTNDQILALTTMRYVFGQTNRLTLVSTPTIAPGSGSAEQLLLLVGGGNVTNVITIQDETALAGSGLVLGSPTRTLQFGQSLLLRWSASESKWYEVAFSSGTVNPTSTFIPYLTNATSFADSPLHVQGTNIIVQGLASEGRITNSVDATESYTEWHDNASDKITLHVSQAAGSVFRMFNAASPYVDINPAATDAFGTPFNFQTQNLLTNTPIFVVGNFGTNQFQVSQWGAVTTGDPGGSGSGAWNLGTVITGASVALTTTNYVEVMINGTLKKLALVQ
jgi:parallel beta helix pectate lyase-like protein